MGVALVWVALLQTRVSLLFIRVYGGCITPVFMGPWKGSWETPFLKEEREIGRKHFKHFNFVDQASGLKRRKKKKTPGRISSASLLLILSAMPVIAYQTESGLPATCLRSPATTEQQNRQEERSEI